MNGTAISLEAIGLSLVTALIALVWRDLDRRMTAVETKQTAKDATDVVFRESVSSTNATLREAVIKLTLQVEMLHKALEQANQRADRTITGAYAALSADSSGPHKTR
jgi:hypothetical protein